MLVHASRRFPTYSCSCDWYSMNATRRSGCIPRRSVNHEPYAKSAAGTANCDKNEHTAAKYAPETTAWRLHRRYHRSNAVSYARVSRVSHAKEATTRTFATASCATALAAASAFCVSRAFSVIHSPYSRLANATKGMMAHARSPSPRFWTQRYAAMPRTRTTASTTLRKTQDKSEATAPQSEVSRPTIAPLELTSKKAISCASMRAKRRARRRRTSLFCTKEKKRRSKSPARR